MLTPQDIQSKAFVKAVFGGYDVTPVDDFIEQVSEDYSALYKENAILKSKLKVLVEKVEEYRSTEDAMRMALLTAQKMGDSLLSEAQEKSDRLLSDAEAEAQEKIAAIAREIDDENRRLQAVKDRTMQFIKASERLLSGQSEFLRKLYDLTDAQETDVVPAPAPAAKEEAAPPADTAEDTAREIESSMSGIIEGYPGTNAVPDQPVSLFNGEDDAEATKKFTPVSVPDEDDESTSPRPKFDFSDLKFGKNYDGK